MARRRTVTGVAPRLLRACGRGLRWLWAHPQPAVVIGLIAGCLWAAWWAVGRSDAFRVTAVTFVPAEMTFDVPKTLLGRHLWEVDVEGLARQLKAQRPSLKRVRVVRLLPDTLQIESLPRLPVAQVRLGSWFAVDAEGYILPEGHATPSDQLIVLKGVESLNAPLKAGRQSTGDAMTRALRVLDRLKQAPELAGHRVAAIDVGDPQQLSFVMDDDVEVRCGEESDLDAHLGRLQAVLKRVANHAVSIRYIDIRFQDPVIAPRT